MEQWDFQNKGKSGWAGKSSFVLEIPLRHLRPSVFYSVPCDWILHIDPAYRAIPEGTGLCSPSEYPSMSCKCQEDGVRLADAIVFEQVRERPLKVNC